MPLNKSIPMTEVLHHYVLSHNPPESDVRRMIREEAEAMSESDLQISPDQAPVLQFLARLVSARRCLEIGVFTGYSSVAVLEALDSDAKMVALDRSEAWTARARHWWGVAGFADRVDLRLGDARPGLDLLLTEPGSAGSFDFAFIDADKESYDRYYEQALRLLRPGGLVVLDNALWNGDVVVPAISDPDTEAIRAINRKVADDARVHSLLLPVADGMLIAQKRTS